MIQPISGNLLIEPITEQTAFSTAQTQYEERGKVISTAWEQGSFAEKLLNGESAINTGDIIYFDSWQAARFKDGEGKDIWLVHIDAVRAVEKKDETS